MNKHVVKLLFLALINIFLSGCASMYIPPSANIPLLQEKYETQIEAGATTNSLYLMTAFAVTDKWALMANGNLSYYNFSNTYDIFGRPSGSGGYYGLSLVDDDHDFAHRYGELGFGRINMLKSPRFKLELFGGGGYGTASDYSDKAEKKIISDNSYFLIFSQVNFGFQRKIGNNNFYIEAGGGLRLAYSHFNYWHTAFGQNPELSLNFNNIHLEPTGFFRIGSKNIRYIFKLGLALRGTFENYDDFEKKYNNYEGLRSNKPVTTYTHFSVGVNFRLGGKKR